MHFFFVTTSRPYPAQRGAIAVELAIVTTVMLMIVAGTIGFGRVFWYADALTKATRDGARMMSTWPEATVNSVGIAAAQTLVANAANAAGIVPQLTATNVEAECLNRVGNDFVVVPCVDGTKPQNVRVGISGFTITIGDLIPIVGGSALLNTGAIGLAPHTLMPSQ